MDERLDGFLKLSAALTGFDRFQLVSTGVGPDYLNTLDSIVPRAIVGRLLEAFGKLPGGDTRGAALSEQVLDDAVLGPVARNVIVLWYSGTWTPLPEAWCETNGRSPRDLGHVVSSAAYLAGLQWAAAGAHPPGGLPPGFASWAEPPIGVEL